MQISDFYSCQTNTYNSSFRHQQTMPLLTKFPYNETGNQHWESLRELFSHYKLHKSEVTGESYYEEQERMILGQEEGEDRPWCCEYTKSAFVNAWNQLKKQYEFWDLMGQRA